MFAGDGGEGVESGKAVGGAGKSGGRLQFRKGGGIGWDASDEETFVEIVDGLVEVQLVEASVLELALGYGVRRTREDLGKGMTVGGGPIGNGRTRGRGSNPGAGS